LQSGVPVLREIQRFESLPIWEALKPRLSWYYAVSTNRMPAKYLICRRIPTELDLKAASEEELWREHERLTRIFLDTWKAIRTGQLRLHELPRASPNLLDLSVELAKRMLTHCNFCRWNCRVDRSRGTKHGTCQLESVSRVSSYFHHPGEELVFRGTMGSGTIFFTSCNMRCSFCLHPDTYVLTTAGPVRIEELFEGALKKVPWGNGEVAFPQHLLVYSHDGRPVRVTKIFKHHHDGELLRVEPLYAPPILLTPEHEVVAYRKSKDRVIRVPAVQLSPEDMLLIPLPKAPQDGATYLDVRGLLSEVAGDLHYSTQARERLPIMAQAIALLNSGRSSRAVALALGYHQAYVRNLASRVRRLGFPSPVRSNSVILEGGEVRLKTEKRPGIPAKVEVTERLAELLGYFCAEGHVTKGARRPSSFTAVFSFGRHEGGLAGRVSTLIREIFGLESKVVERATTLSVEVSKSSLALLLKELCGHKASAKRVPSFLFTSPPEIIRAFLAAYYRGDGCTTSGYLSANTTSRELAMGLYALHLLLGHLPSFNIYEPPPEKTIQGRRVQQATLYYVKVRLDRMVNNDWRQAARVRYKFQKDYVLVPIHRISRVRYSGPVYNIEVADPSHTYTANFLGIGNCQNGDISTDKDNGIPVTPKQLALMAWQLRMEGVHNINWVGGEPTIHLHTIVEAISLLDCFRRPDPADLGHIMQVKSDYFEVWRLNPQYAYYNGEFNVPQLWNSNFYFSQETARILRCLIDVWLPDFKMTDKCALRIARTPWYFETVSRNHKMVYEWGEDMVVRILIMPGHNDCCIKPILRWIAENMPDVPINLMDQYHPDNFCNPASPKFDPRYADLARFPTREEILEAYSYAKELGLNFEPLSYEKSVYGLRAP